MKIMPACSAAVLALLLLLSRPASAAGTTWTGGHSSADAACKAIIGDGGYYPFHRAEVKGDLAYCYTKSKDGEGDEIYSSAVFKEDPPPEKDKDEAGQSKKDEPAAGGGEGAPPPPSKDDKDKFKSKCLDQYFGSEWEPELKAAYGTTNSGVGGAEGGVVGNGNVAVLEWKEGGARKRQKFTSGDGHSEQHLLAFLNEKKIPKESVTRIFSELSPCEARCLPALSAYFAGARKNITLEFNWLHSGEGKYSTCKGKNANALRSEVKAERRKRAVGGP